MRRARRRRLPREAAAHLPKDQRVLASAPTADGAWAVATTRAVGVVSAEGVRWSRPWRDVDHGAWESDTDSLTVRWVDGAPDVTLDLPGAPRAFLQAFRERVQHSVVHVESLALPGGANVRAVIRRDGDESLMSQVIVDGARPLTDAELTAVNNLEARVRRAAGMPA